MMMMIMMVMVMVMVIVMVQLMVIVLVMVLVMAMMIWSLVFDIPMIRILALYLDFEGAKIIYVLEVLIWGLGGRWRFLTGVWHPDIDLDMVTGIWYILCQILALCLDFEGAKNIYVLKVLIWGFEGCWRFLTGVWHPNIDLDIVMNLAWIFSEVLIMLRSVKSQIQGLSKSQISSDKLVPVWLGRSGLDSAKIRFGSD